VCDLETSRICAPYIYIYDISSLRVKHSYGGRYPEATYYNSPEISCDFSRSGLNILLSALLSSILILVFLERRSSHTYKTTDKIIIVYSFNFNFFLNHGRGSEIS